MNQRNLFVRRVKSKQIDVITLFKSKIWYFFLEIFHCVTIGQKTELYCVGLNWPNTHMHQPKGLNRPPAWICEGNNALIFQQKFSFLWANNFFSAFSKPQCLRLYCAGSWQGFGEDWHSNRCSIWYIRPYCTTFRFGMEEFHRCWCRCYWSR